MRRRRLIASVVIPGLVTGLVMFSSPAGAAMPPLDATKVKASSTPEIPVGFGAGAAGDIVLGDSTVQFQAGDSVTIRIDDADLDPNCEAGPGFRDFIALESVPTASIPGPDRDRAGEPGLHPTVCRAGRRHEARRAHRLRAHRRTRADHREQHPIHRRFEWLDRGLREQRAGAAQVRRRGCRRPAVQPRHRQHVERVDHTHLADRWRRESSDPAALTARDAQPDRPHRTAQ